mgnify:CR=1 FL=1
MTSRRSLNSLMLTAALLQIAQAAPPVTEVPKPVRTKPRSRMSLERERKRNAKRDFPVGYRR